MKLNDFFVGQTFITKSLELTKEDITSLKNKTGLVTVKFSTFNSKEELVFEGDLTVLVKK
ncbi:hypothetical protein [Paenibacillus tundrae]|uniref:hypothetical protein n=1 Tax=Paenibacillus tundrae TaxID=528187 RepID=UPI0030D5BC88